MREAYFVEITRIIEDAERKKEKKDLEPSLSPGELPITIILGEGDEDYIGILNNDLDSLADEGTATVERILQDVKDLPRWGYGHLYGSAATNRLSQQAEAGLTYLKILKRLSEKDGKPLNEENVKTLETGLNEFASQYNWLHEIPQSLQPADSCKKCAYKARGVMRS